MSFHSRLSFLPFALIMIIILIALVLIFAPCFRPQHNSYNKCRARGVQRKWSESWRKRQRKGKFAHALCVFFFVRLFSSVSVLFIPFLFLPLLLFIFVCFVLFGSTRLHKLLFSVFYVLRLFLRSSWHWLSCWCARSFSRYSLFVIFGVYFLSLTVACNCGTLQNAKVDDVTKITNRICQL